MPKSTSTPETKARKADRINTKSLPPKSKRPAGKGTSALRKSARAETAPTREDFDRESMIRYAAYFLAERDGFQSGREKEYWLQAEKQIDQLLSARP